jgi:AcrR family transcriptional regulator
MAESAARRSGRRRGGRGRADSGTREAILASARRLFADRGYAETSLRTIAADAGVTPPLVIHFFGSKAGLLVAALDWPFDPQDVVPDLLAGRRSEIGERLVRLFVSTWDDPDARSTLRSLLESATADERAAALLREFVVSQLIGPLTAALGKPGDDVRANLIAAQMIGVAMLRHVLKVAPLKDMASEDLVVLLAPPVQRLLTGPLPGADG